MRKLRLPGIASLVFIANLIVVGVSFAADGGMEGGGGKGVRCGTLLRTLDLYEAEEIHHLPIPQNSLSLDSHLRTFGPILLSFFENKATDPEDPSQVERFMLDVKKIMARITDIPMGSRLPLTHDATVAPLPTGCEVVQIAIYADDGRIYRDQEYWNQLSTENQAALILHEALYHAAKEMGAKTSDEVRGIIGLLFARQLPEPILKPIWDAQNRLVCTAGGVDGADTFMFYAIDESRNGKQGIGLYFPIFSSTMPMRRVQGFVPEVSLSAFTYPLSNSLEGRVYDGSLRGYWNFLITPNRESSFPGDAIGNFNIQVWRDGDSRPMASFGYCFGQINAQAIPIAEPMMTSSG